MSLFSFFLRAKCGYQNIDELIIPRRAYASQEANQVTKIIDLLQDKR